MKFYLGTHMPNWLEKTSVPLFISRRRLFKRKKMPHALGPWALDSGGFTELNKVGRWSVEPERYIDEVRRFRDEIGNLEWAAPQDWMCEPFVLKKTGRTIDEHQALTVVSVLDLRRLAPDVRWIPVLQGWELADYLRCAERYEHAGVDLRAEPDDGLGSVCRRQKTAEAARIVQEFAARGIRLHGFGFKTLGLDKTAHLLASSDSMAWSYAARREAPKFLECVGKHKNCANCFPWAMRWRKRLENRLDRRLQAEQAQGRLFA